MILGIETATPVLSVALVDEGSVLFSALVGKKNCHDELLVPLIDAMMKQVGRDMKELEGVAVSAGPGSFTGLRIGMAAAKGIVMSLDIPLVAIPTFDAMAWRMARRIPETGVFFAPVFEARRGDVYAALFETGAGAFTCIRPVAVLPAEEFASSLPDRSWLAGDGAPLLLKQPDKQFRVVVDDDSLCRADAVALYGSELLAAGHRTDPSTCEPMYIRDFRTTVPRNRIFGMPDNI
jgi:tRNA threonylcarbamoyladenosine biosynthesis protein TsaB